MADKPAYRSVSAGLVLVLSLLLVMQAGASRMLTFDEVNLSIPRLHDIPPVVAKWNADGEQSLDAGIVNYLKPADYILRDYSSSAGKAPVNLFVAYFKSLQNTYGPHAPRICLPGSGWLETSSQVTSLTVLGRTEGIPANQLTYEKAGQRILVLYWYQNDRSIWAEEFRAKLRLLPDLVRYHRSDVSLVRLVAPVHSATAAAELTDCEEFARMLFPSLVERFNATSQ